MEVVMDSIRMPQVKNTFKQGDFVLTILAYRKLSANEILMAAGKYLQSVKRKTMPQRGSATFVTTIGFDGF